MKFEVGDIVKLKASGDIGVIDSFDLYFDIVRIKFKEGILSVTSSDIEPVVTDEAFKGVADKIMNPLLNIIEDCYRIMGLKDTSPLPTEEERTEAERDLYQMGKDMEDKAKKYDRICETFFMASGMVEDGDSFKWIIDPETVLDAVLNVILADIKTDRESIVFKKRDAVNRVLNEKKEVVW